MHLIYILHFDEPLCHARHYVGVAHSSNLHRRLRDHAMGNGARLTEVLLDRGINWQVGGLIETSGHPRIYEDMIKRGGHTKVYCEICTKRPHKLPTCRAVSPKLLKFAHDSISLRSDSVKRRKSADGGD